MLCLKKNLLKKDNEAVDPSGSRWPTVARQQQKRIEGTGRWRMPKPPGSAMGAALRKAREQPSVLLKVVVVRVRDPQAVPRPQDGCWWNKVKDNFSDVLETDSCRIYFWFVLHSSPDRSAGPSSPAHVCVSSRVRPGERVGEGRRLNGRAVSDCGMSWGCFDRVQPYFSPCHPYPAAFSAVNDREEMAVDLAVEGCVKEKEMCVEQDWLWRSPNHRDSVAVQLLRTARLVQNSILCAPCACSSFEMKLRCPVFHVTCGTCWAESPPRAPVGSIALLQPRSTAAFAGRVVGGAGTDNLDTSRRCGGFSWKFQGRQ
ncbi:uncharacterized protein LOC135576405 isoform X3 [Columba livia]